MVVALSCPTRPAAADPADVSWSADFAVAGVEGEVRAVVEWNGAMVVGGAFTHASGVRADGVAISNGGAFSPMGAGFDGPVNSLVVVAGSLYAAGDFSASGATPLPNVARWTGSEWVAVGGGAPDFNGGLQLVGDGGTLLLLGEFTEIGSPPVSAQAIARWNGSAWSDVEGFSPPSGGHLASAVRVGARLYVGGAGLHYLEGSTWTYDFGGLDGQVISLAALGSDLYACGEFTRVDGVDPVGGLARFDGTAWSSLADVEPDGGFTRLVEAGGQLVLLGWFETPGPGVAFWDGSSWTAGPYRILGTPQAAAPVGSDLVLGGSFTAYQDALDGFASKNAGGVVAFDGTNLRSVGPGGGTGGLTAVRGLASYGGRLVAVGDFRRIGTAGEVRAVAAWDGTEWARLGSGLSEPFNNPSARNVTVWGGKLAVSGYFTGAGAVASENVITWNGTAWEGLDGGFSMQGVNLADFGGTLIASHAASSPGIIHGTSQPQGQVARWTGAQWQTIGTTVPVFSLSDHGLTVWNGRVVYGGSFSSINGVPALNVAQWDGASWSAMGAGFNGFVTSLAVHDGDLYASGLFTASGATPLPGRMARWNGSAWEAVGLGLDAPALAMASAGGRLHVTGGISQAGGSPATKVAAWDGGTWSTLGSGLGAGLGGNSGSGLCLAAYQGGLFFGGYFNRAGDKASNGIARWQLSGALAVAPPRSDRALDLSAPYPNPSTSRVSLALRLAEDGEAEAAVYDAGGRRVRVLASGPMRAGVQRLEWRGDDDSGRRAPAGLYWVRVATRQGSASRRIVWME